MSFLSHQSDNRRQSAHYQDRRAIVFINSNFTNCNTLIQQVAPEARVIAIGLWANGVKEITRILNSSCCREVYIIAQGSPGCLYLGDSELSLNSLIQYDDRLQSWFNLANKSNLDCPHIHLHGCNVAAGDMGEEFITKLSSLTGAMISASARVTNSKVFHAG